MPKEPRVRTLIESQHVKCSETLLKSARQNFCHFFFIIQQKNKLKKFSFSSIWNLYTVSEHIDTQWNVLSLSKSECLTKAIQMQIPQNQKIFSEFLLAFPASTSNLECFKREVAPQRLFVSQIIDGKKPSYLNA